MLDGNILTTCCLKLTMTSRSHTHPARILAEPGIPPHARVGSPA